VNEVFERIAAEIRKAGVVPFARFMELALYCPVYGYYEAEADTVGRQGDFYTSVSVGPLFGELLAFQFADWLTCIERHESLTADSPDLEVAESKRVSVPLLVETGAHQGLLAGDILQWFRAWRPALYERLAYWIVEPSARRREWQKAAVQGFDGKVFWAENLAGVAFSTVDSGFEGIVFSNELFDAMPVHRYGWDARQRLWYEWGVGVAGSEFEWVRIPRQTSSAATSTPIEQPAEQALAQLPEALLAVLPDGFVVETCPAAKAWWQEAASCLRSGKLVAVDYGWEREEFYRPERPSGTLRAYSRHHVQADLLARPGEQDLTAQVNFSELREAGEALGLKTEVLETQARFLTRLAARTWEPGAQFPEWVPARTRQFQTLTHPEHLGRSFRVLVQSRCKPQNNIGVRS
jgi:SAM-dependent MidA family methyltransferase